MNRRIIISEQEKFQIRNMYSIISEQDKPVEKCTKTPKTTPETLGLNTLEPVETILEKSNKDLKDWIKTQDENLRKVGQTVIPLDETCRDKSKYYSPNNYNNQLIQLLKTSCDEASKKNFTALDRRIKSSVDLSKKEDELSYFYTFNNLLRDFLTTWNENGPFDLEVTINKTESEAPAPAPEPINGGGANNLVLPEFKPTGDLYKDNWWEVTDNLKTQFQEQVLKKIQETQKAMPGVELSLKSLTVETSASRLRNKNGAEQFSFLELSQNRNNSTVNYIKEALKSVNIKNVDGAQLVQNFEAKKTTTNPNGNGDGSSGPNPPEGYFFVPVGNVKMSVQGKDRNEAGAPLNDIKQYDQFKFVKVQIVLDAKVPPNTTTKPQVASPKIQTTFDYDIKVGGASKKKKTITITINRKSSNTKTGKIEDFFYDFLHIDKELCAAYN